MKDAKYFDPRNAGWMDAEELNKIKELTEGKGEVLEVGCYCGRSTRALLQVTTGIVVCIDPLHRNGWMPRWPTPDGLHLDSHAHMADLVAEFHYRLIVVPAFSREMYKLFRRAVDVLMIDSDHSYQSTKEELDAFGPLVRDGGVIILDDFDLEPVATAWRDCTFRSQRPYLMMETYNSLGFVKVVSKERSEPDPITATPV